MTTHTNTGYKSTIRNIEWKFTNIRGRRNAEKAQAGEMPKVLVEQKEPVEFIYHQGPKLRRSTGGLNGEKIPLTAILGM
jgi:hypothetical protein